MERLGLPVPTEVQRRALPFAAAGRNVVVRAGTGSGKTLAFVLPMLSNLDYVQRALPQARLPASRCLLRAGARPLLA